MEVPAPRPAKPTPRVCAALYGVRSTPYSVTWDSLKRGRFRPAITDSIMDEAHLGLARDSAGLPQSTPYCVDMAGAGTRHMWLVRRVATGQRAPHPGRLGESGCNCQLDGKIAPVAPDESRLSASPSSESVRLSRQHRRVANRRLPILGDVVVM